jgi:hypothetical protein
MPVRSANTTAKPYVLGRSRFAAITAIEGLKLSPAGEIRLQRTRALSPEQRRAETTRAFATQNEIAPPPTNS